MEATNDNRMNFEVNYREESKSDLTVITEVFSDQSLSLNSLKKAPLIDAYFKDITRRNSVPLIIDAGANIGASTIWFLNAYSSCKVISIEPEQGNIEVLRLNVQNLNVTVIEGAVSDESGLLFLHDPGSGDWGFRVSREYSNRPINSFSINELLGEPLKSVEVPFICKIDIEGGEEALFNSNTEWVEKFPILIIEIHDWMLPGRSVSKNFFKKISEGNFDIVMRGQLIFAINNDLIN